MTARTLFLYVSLVFVGYSQTVSDCEWQDRMVPCVITAEGMAIVEGDIVIGEVDSQPARKGPQIRSIVRQGEQFRWPGAVVPYEIDPAIPNPRRIQDAIDHFHALTPVKLVPRNAEADYVRFRRFNAGGVCTSAVGRTGGMQAISVDDSCGVRTLIHEIGHALGFFHEQSRYDRDQYVELLVENVDDGRLGQFMFPAGGKLQGDYDYASVMHYSAFAFSRGGPAMNTIPLGIPIGVGQGLSAGDLDAIERLYTEGPRVYRISTNPEGLPYSVDGETYTATRIFQWAPGSVHTIAAAASLPGTGPEDRWDFGRWSNSGPSVQTIVADPNRTFFTANYRRMRRVTLRAADARMGRVEVEPHADGGFYADGAAITIRAVANPGYYFQAWQVGGRVTHGASLNPVPLTVRSLVAYTAMFSSKPLTTIATTPPNFQVRVDGREYLAPQSFAWEPGEVHQVEPVPPPWTPSPDPRGDPPSRFRLEGWEDGGPLMREVTARQSPLQLTARYREQVKVSVLGATNGASVVLTPDSADSYWDKGQALSFTAQPGPAPFSHWSGPLVSSANPLLWELPGPATLTANFVAPFTVSRNGVMNGASLEVSSLSPGGIFSIFGLELGPEAPLHGIVDRTTGRVATLLGGVRVLVNGIAAPLLYVQSRQINAVAPYAIRGERGAEIRVEFNGRLSAPYTAPLAEAGPGIFTLDGSGRGPGAILNQDYTLNSAANPAPRGSVIMCWSTGLGQTEPAGQDGQIAGAVLPRPLAAVTARLGGRPAPVEWVSVGPGLVAGAFQINIRIPPDAPAGPAVRLEISAGVTGSQRTVTVAIQ